MQLILDPDIKQIFASSQSPVFDQLMQLRGQVYRELENRCTQKISLNQQNYFIKQHFGVGWKEILKNLFQLRLPIVSAKNEWLALQRLKQLNIQTQTIVGYGNKGINPARKKSFLLTQELPPLVSLEDFCKNWVTDRPSFWLKYSLIHEVARIASTLHQNGINHRDFYICHFLLDLIKYNNTHDKKGLPLTIYLIDLHRAQIRRRTPHRWIIKDLAGLYFSSKDVGITLRDQLRFIKAYRNKPLRDILNKEITFWLKVKKRGDKLYQRHAGN